MESRGRDNLFVERLWRMIKYEEVYLRAYNSVSVARESLRQYLKFYNTRRSQSSLDGRTPLLDGVDAPSRHRCAKVAVSKLATRRKRGGSVRLHSFEPFLKWISRSVTPRPGLVATG